MKLEQMYRNVLDMNFAELELKVMADSDIRARMIAATSKNDIAVSSKTRLSDQEKAILKSLGLNMKTVKSLQGVLL
jgi:tetrahydromethanopterin S-methyltransferase subunit H